LISFLLARAISRPVRSVAEAARSLADGRSPEPLPATGARELALLATSFNDMAEQLARAQAAERSFLLSVSHELKTPLTAIRGYAEAVSEGAIEPEEAAETIVREAARLERLVRDLLDLARMNRSEFSVHAEPIDLAAVAREVAGRYDAQSRAFDVTLEAETPDTAPAIGDADRTVQVVSNLVENALRVTPPGGMVRIAAEPGKVTVEDTGPGLQPDEVPRAFERFFLYDRYGAERAVGSGLGLAIVKTLAEGMGGSVEVESDPGRLTRFVVRLPSAPAGAPAERELISA
jgi:two-component system OmpR family sensor kinase